MLLLSYINILNAKFTSIVSSGKYFTDLIRSHFGPDKQISVILEDTPENDHKSIFKLFQGKFLFFSHIIIVELLII